MWAYFQPSGPAGGWSWSNAGAIVSPDDGEYILVDTLMDAELTRAMLDSLPADADFSGRLILTHGDVDHVNGVPELDVGSTEIIAHAGAEMRLIPRSTDRMVTAGSLLWRLIERWGALARAMHGFAAGRRMLAFAKFASLFEAFHMAGPAADLSGYAIDTFEGERRTVDAFGHRAELIHPGPAHTAGDLLVHLPSAGALFAGDLVFYGCNPIAWAGDARRIINILERIKRMEGVDVIVPGHGPAVDVGAIAVLVSYWVFVEQVAAGCSAANLTDAAACARAAMPSLPQPFPRWEHPERLYINVDVEMRHLAARGGGAPEYRGDGVRAGVTHEQKLALIVGQAAVLADAHVASLL